MCYDDVVAVAGAVAGAADTGAADAGAAGTDAADTTGTVLTAAGVTTAPVGRTSPGAISTTSCGSAMPRCTAIASRRARISGLYNGDFGLIKHKSSLCPQGAPNALHHLQVYLFPQVRDALVAYAARMAGATTAPLAYAGNAGWNIDPSTYAPVPTDRTPYVPYINGACTGTYPCTACPDGCPYITTYLATSGAAALYACASLSHSSLAARTTSPHATEIPDASISQRAFLSSTLCFNCPSNYFSNASMTDSSSNPNLARASSTLNTNYGQLSLNLRCNAKNRFFFCAAVSPNVVSTDARNSDQLRCSVPPGGV